MGKAARRPMSAPRDISEADMQQVAGLKEEGNKSFGRKEYSKAMDSYDRALKLLPDSHSDSVLLHSNKAACSMMLKKYKEAVNECSSALGVAPDNQKALLRRAKAYEAMGLYKQALSDVQKANKAEDAPPENQATEKRLRDIIAGRKPAGGSGAVVGRRRTAGAASRPQMTVFQAKCTLGDETRLLHIGPNVTYAEMLEGVKAKFPGAGPFALKFLDREGDLVTMTSRADLQRAIAEAISAGQAGPHGPRLSNAMPPIRLQLVPVASQDDVPAPPPEEQAQLMRLIEGQAKLLEQAHAAQQQKQAKQEPQPPEVVEIDQWIVDFAHLFRDQAGLDFDRHIELHNLGWDKIQEAMDSTLRSDKALPLLDAAADRFAEVTISGLLQWGNTYTMVARKHLDDAAADGKPISDLRAVIDEQWSKAEAKYNEAMAVKGEHVDVLQFLASLEMERAKLAAGVNVGNRKPEDGKTEGDKAEGTADKAPAAAKSDADMQREQQEQQRQLQEWTAAAQCAAIDELSPEQAAAGDVHWEKCFEYVKRMVAAVPEEQRKVRSQQQPEGAKPAEDVKPAEDAKPAGDAPAADGNAAQPADKGEAAEQPQTSQQSEEEFFTYAQVLLNWGNFLYERSQLAARAGQEWRPLLDEAEVHFRDAGCAEGDIRGALKNHYCKDQLDLGPDPVEAEPAPAAEPTANGSADKDAMPSLPAKPAKKKVEPATATA